jgi:phage antirepressor YoqD-like protein
LQDIREKSLHEFEEWIIPSKYKAGNGQEYPEFLLTKDGFTMLVFNYEGYLEFKKSYIDKFNDMSKQLQFKVPTSFKEALLLAAEQQGKIEEQEQLLLEQKPKVDFYEDVIGSSSTFDMGKVAKVLNFPKVGRNKLFEILRNEGVLQKDNTPYQSYVDKGWFRLVESKYTKPNGDINVTYKTVVFQKGVNGIARLLKNSYAA